MDFSYGANGAPFGNNGVPFGQQGEPKPRKPRKPVGNVVTRTLINLGVTLGLGLIWFYLELPAINLQSEDFYVFALGLCAVYCICAVLTSGFQGDGIKGYFHFLRKQCTVPFFLAVALVIVALVGSVAGWVPLRANAYAELLNVQQGDFAQDIEEISYDQIPMLDAASASQLGSRKLGELSDMVSQFEILPTYSQINYQNCPVRVTSLRYGDTIKWLTNRSNGLPAYLVIDMVTQEAEVVRLDEGMKYTTAEHFSRNLYRLLRFRYPTMMFATPVFEIDDEGTPYWVCPRTVKTIGLFGGTDIHGAVLVNAVTGESEYYEEVPSWVDRVYSADLIIEQYDYYGRYHNGFLNSMFGQRDVTLTTEGYNYIAIDDDVYMYTGVTSVTSDQSNIGFILCNQRTKETHFYSVAGATETSAQASAQSQVQQMRYTATFPLLLNIADQPTYFISLKGDDGLVKMYAMVNVQQYSIVSTGSTVADCEQNYRTALAHNGLIREEEAELVVPDRDTMEGAIAEIRTAVLDGDSYYFIRLEDSEVFVTVNAAENPLAVILNVGDRVRLSYEIGDNASILTGASVELLAAAEPAEAATPESAAAA
ncbi:MAG: CvpA family protein [Oscillospiraceae bacterium]|nr:CvpA family protein [Oscillospiraceae bacterium]